MAKNKGVNAAAMAALLQLAAGSAGAAPAFVYLRGYPGDILYTDGSRTLDITPPGFARKAGNPSVSPDGKRVVFPANLDDNWDLYLGEFDGSRLAGVRPLTRTPRDREEDPRFSPDGKRIAYRGGSNASSRIFIHELSTGRSRQVTTDAAGEEWAPAFSPDGKWLAFTRGTSRTEPRADVYLVPVSGGPARRLTYNGGVDWYPSFCADGTLVYVSQRGDGNDDDLYAIPPGRLGEPRPDDFARRLPVNSHASEADPVCFAEGGAGLAYVSNASGRYAVYIWAPPAAASAAASDPGGDLLGPVIIAGGKPKAAAEQDTARN